MDTCRGFLSSIQHSADRHMQVIKLPEARERSTEKIKEYRVKKKNQKENVKHYVSEFV